MFHVHVIAVGKNKDQWVADAVAHYTILLKKYISLQITYTPEIKKTKSITDVEVMKREAPLLKKHIKAPHVIALTERGRSMDSQSLADEFGRLIQRQGGCDIIIGGAYGLDQSLVNECHDCLSLSPMTMSHQLVRPVLLEQLYRAFSILAGGKYHK